MSAPSTMPQPAMSMPTRLLCTVGLPASFAGLAYYSPPTAALTPILLSPTIFAAWQRHKLPPAESGNVEVATWTYLGMSVLGPVAAAMAQLGMCSLMFKLLFGSRGNLYMQELQRTTLEGVSTDIIDTRKLMAWNPRYTLSIAVLSYFGAGLVEEGLKYLALRLAVWRARPKHEQEYLIYAAAAGLGYGTIENILVTYGSVTNKDSTAMLALTTFERLIFASVGHTIMALLTALKSVRRDARGEKLPIWRVLAKSVFYHGTMDFMLFSLSAWHGNIGWIHPTDVGSIAFAIVAVVTLQGNAVWDALRQLKQLQLRPCQQ
ncbi:hypothetical protein Q7P37_006163 [Cladosporium fusiforme]